ncbi:MAG: UDP-3-O-(3-hydroxymyristoyl)glucosamine N-acyltransferase [bacterium]
MTLTARELADQIGAEVVGDPNVIIEGVAKIEEASPQEVTFISNPAYRRYLQTTRASAIIIDSVPEGGAATYLVTPQPYLAFLKVLRLFHPESPPPAAGVHPSAVIGENVTIGSGASIGPLCVLEDGVTVGKNSILRGLVFIGRNVEIGDNCLFHSRVSIREGCRIGNRVILQDGCVIGSDGFGFAQAEGGYEKIPQVGIVILEDDVEIGANTTIDRATLGHTILRRGVKLDNLVQIAHNVEVGQSTVMAAQTGIAGSTTIGAKSVIGGQVGVAGHLHLSDGIMVAAQSGITKNPGAGKIVAGSPARDIQVWRRIEASLSRLPELIKRIRNLEEGGAEDRE